MSEAFLSIIIPAYDEEENIKKGVLEEVFSYLKKQKYSWEVIIVNDGSTDKTAELTSAIVKNLFRKSKIPVIARRDDEAIYGRTGLLRFARNDAKRERETFQADSKNYENFHILNTNHRGKGKAIIEGIKNSKGKIILFTDMDQSTPLNQLEKFLPEFENGYDVVIGSREKREGIPFIRKLTGIGFTFLRKLLLNLPYKDTQCGFKAFRKEAIEKILSKMKIEIASLPSVARNDEGFLMTESVIGPSYGVDFDLEILYFANMLNLKVKEVAVEWRYKNNQSFNPVVHSWQAFKGIVTIKSNMLLGKYKY
ncbi:MAG: glycosyltransferase [Candidatus Levybacteria bacterium]|nr:glycosyltransferase [Candidatus Levybacteria bacterium]